MDKEKKSIEWLYRQLPEWVEKGLLPQERADALREHYGQQQAENEPSLLQLLAAILGVALVGLGIILIVAHNWDQLSRMNRLVLLLAQLLTAQIATGYAIWKKSDHAAWCEGSGFLLALSVGAALALIGQTYHLSDARGNFLLLWMLLVLPLPYLLKAAMPALSFLAIAMVWLFWGAEGIAEKQWIWLLLVLVLPYYWQTLRENMQSRQSALLSWAILICGYASFVEIFQRHISELDFLIYGALFAATYLSGRIWFDGNDTPLWHNPYKIIGFSGLLLLSVALTFHEFWHDVHWLSSTYCEQWLAGTLTAAALLLLWHSLRCGRSGWFFGIQPVWVATGSLLAQEVGSWAAVMLFNAYGLLIGIRAIKQGVSRNHLGRLNGGLLLVGLLILSRFFDLNYSYVMRGTVFVAVGAVVLLLNAWIVRRKGKVVQ